MLSTVGGRLGNYSMDGLKMPPVCTIGLNGLELLEKVWKVYFCCMEVFFKEMKTLLAHFPRKMHQLQPYKDQQLTLINMHKISQPFIKSILQMKTWLKH